MSVHYLQKSYLQNRHYSKKVELIIAKRDPKEFYIAEDFTEEVRKFLYSLYGFKTLYKKGLSVRSTIDTYYQDEAYKALKWGIQKYDERHGWRGPIFNVGGNVEDFINYEYNKKFPKNWSLALVTKIQKNLSRIITCYISG